MAVMAASGWRRGAGDGGSSRCRRGRRQLLVGHYAAVTANGAGLLPGAGGGRSMVVVAADVVAVVEVQPSIK